MVWGGCAKQSPPPIAPQGKPAVSAPVKPDSSDQAEIARRAKISKELTADHIEVQFPLDLICLLPGETLGFGVGTTYTPRGSTEGIYLRDKYGLLPIEKPADLIGRVQIDSERKALQFVRLFTSPDTQFYFGMPLRSEIIPISAVTEDFVFRNKMRLDYLRETCGGKNPKQEEGILPDKLWQKLGLPGASVKRTPEGFTVTRNIVEFKARYPGAESNLVQREEETVTADGRIGRKILSSTEVKGLTVPLPEYYD
jgi:hypothetical protein